MDPLRSQESNVTHNLHSMSLDNGLKGFHGEPTASPESSNEQLHNSVYEPLPPGWSRVVCIRPGHWEDPFDLELLPVDVKDVGVEGRKIQYKALSYTWGDKPEMVRLAVSASGGHQKVIWVTRSLIIAIHHIRQPHLAVNLWVDQISIDQSSSIDKSAQIPLMKEIYEKADDVIVWLGEAADDSDVAIDKLCEVLAVRLRYLAAHPDTPREEVEIRPFVSKCFSDYIGPSTPGNIRAWHAVSSLLNRSWFSRAWILQEATTIHMNHVSVVCGAKVVPMLAILIAFHLYQDVILMGPNGEHSFLRLPESRNLGDLKALEKFVDFQRRKHPPTLLELLQLVRIRKATDARDKLFCILTFADDVRDDTRLLDPDYSKSARRVYVDFVIWYAHRYRNLDFLGDCWRFRGDFEGGGEELGLPHWVPNWTVEWSGTPPLEKYTVSRNPTSSRLYSASGPFINAVTVCFPPPQRPELLTLSGVYLTSIETVLNGARSNRSEGLLAVERSWQPSESSQLCPLNAITTLEVFRKTLCADFTADGYGNNRRGGRSVDLKTVTGPSAVSRLRQVTKGRRLFYTTTSVDGAQGLMGIGSVNTRLEDQVWMLKGGSVLYILRPEVQGRPDDYSTLNLTDGPNDTIHIDTGDTLYRFVGEAFILGLMDGEAVDMIGESPKRPRPPPLESMDRDFRMIHLL